MLARRTKLMKPSAILMLAAKANELKAQGKDVISLTVGEPDWDTYENIKEAAIASIRKGMTKYTPSNGIADLRKAVAQQISQDLGIPYDMNEITVSAGAKFVLFAALQAVCDPGDEVLIPAPFWASYTTMVELAEAQPRIVICDAKSDFKMTPELLRQGLNSKTKALLLNSPSNPTGKVYSKSELKALADVLRDFPRVVIISDDIYNRLLHNGEPLAPHILQAAPELRTRTIALNGASKSYSMTGWRLGWAAGPREVISAMTNYQSQSVSCASATSQYAALEAVLHSEPEVRKTCAVLRERRDLLVKELGKIDGIHVHPPDGAFYIWMDVSHFMGKSLRGRTLHNSADLSAALLEEKLVAVVPGVEFGIDGFFRLSFALETAKAKDAATRMGEFFRELK
jgi:aspartate aminotransferase